MPVFSVVVEEVITTVYAIEAESRDEAELRAGEAHESPAQPGLIGSDASVRSINAAMAH